MRRSAASVCGSGGDWEAGTYHRVSQPHVGWGSEVLDRLELHGDETILDAGCGTGKVTAQLVALLPRGRVIGVDRSPAMIAEARRLLPKAVELHVQDLVDLKLPAPVDVVVSSAVFHWIPDHERLFACLARVLRAEGRLEAQCGGAGNIASVEAAIAAVSDDSRWRERIAGWPGPWTYAGPAATANRLRRNGFSGVRCWLEPRDVRPADPVAYLRSVVLGSHLDRLPAELHDAFVAAVHDELIRTNRAAGGPGEVVLDYVRLNMSATRG